MFLCFVRITWPHIDMQRKTLNWNSNEQPMQMHIIENVNGATSIAHHKCIYDYCTNIDCRFRLVVSLKFHKIAVVNKKFFIRCAISTFEKIVSEVGCTRRSWADATSCYFFFIHAIFFPFVIRDAFQRQIVRMTLDDGPVNEHLDINKQSHDARQRNYWSAHSCRHFPPRH